MAKKLRVGILFGGRSGEHEVSLLSAASILKAIDRKKFDVVPIGITKEGHWLAAADAHEPARRRSERGRAASARRRSRSDAGRKAAARGHSDAARARAGGSVRRIAIEAAAADGQVASMWCFPVLHGTFGEDGTIQGLFELAGIAYVGSGVLGSSAGMDKDVMKRLFAQAGLPIVKHVTVLRSEWEKSPRKAIAQIEAALKYPLFVKPANLGSSVGISKAHDRKELGPALDLAAKYDRKLVVEQGVGGKKVARPRTRSRRARQRRSQGQRGRRNHSRQGVLRLRSQVPVRRLGAGDSRQAHPRRSETDSRDGGGRVSRLRSCRAWRASTS